MTKPSEVTERIERILDEARCIPRGLARGQRAALLASATVAVYLTAALQPYPARGQQQAPARVSVLVAAPGQFETVSDAEAARLEAAIAANPEDLQSRAKLVQYYTAKAMVQQRDAHIFWIVEHHPEFDQKKFPVLMVFSNPGPLQDIAGHERVGQLWQEQARAHANDPRVVMNAAQYLIPYYRARRELYAAERWEKRRRELDPSREWGLGSFYAMAIIGSTTGQGPYNDAGFAAHARSELDNSADGAVVWNAGYSLDRSTSDRPDLVSLNGYGKQLQRRAVEQLGFTPPPFPTAEDRASAAAARNAAMKGPEPLKRVDPVYPPAAQQVRLQGVVRLRVLITLDGTVKQVETVNGHPMLVNAARDAVKQWVYPPQAMETLVEVEIPFRLP